MAYERSFALDLIRLSLCCDRLLFVSNNLSPTSNLGVKSYLDIAFPFFVVFRNKKNSTENMINDRAAEKLSK